MYQDQLSEILTRNIPYLSNIIPSDWAEKNRNMTSDVSPWPGKFSYDRTPYLKEPVDCLSPDHPAKRIAVMKGAQIGFSTGVIENGIGWIIDQQPGTILLAAMNDDMVKQMMETKIDQMIDSSGLRPLIKPNVLRARNQRTGDTSQSKEFPGGWLKAYSIQKPQNMRQISCMYGFLDDFESAPQASKDAGSADKLFETRFAAYGGKMKLFYISTPEIQQTSNIEPLYDKGDKRRYHVSCPCCGSMITLEWSLNINGKKAGIHYKLDNHGRLILSSVGYVCQSCGGFFKDNKKTELLQSGNWEPTVIPSAEDFYSYQISALYAPQGAYNWKHYAQNYVDACPVEGKIDIDAYKTFTQTCLGLTWKDKTLTPDAKGIINNTRDYDIGVVPDNMSIEDGNGEIVLITLACDLNGIVEDARLDWEIVAYAENGVSYSVNHGSIGTFVPRENQQKKKIKRDKWSYDLFESNSVWPEFSKIIETELSCESGEVKYVQIAGIDTGHYTNYAYSYMDSFKPEIAILVGLKGKPEDNLRKEGADTATFRSSKHRGDLYLVESNLVKDELSENMQLKWVGDAGQPPLFMNFPQPSSGKYTSISYFSHYEAEERVVRKTISTSGNKSFQWEKRNSAVQNHFWDVRLYNNVLKDIITFLICKEKGVPFGWNVYVKVIKRII